MSLAVQVSTDRQHGNHLPHADFGTRQTSGDHQLSAPLQAWLPARLRMKKVLDPLEKSKLDHLRAGQLQTPVTGCSAASRGR